MAALAGGGSRKGRCGRFCLMMRNIVVLIVVWYRSDLFGEPQRSSNSGASSKLTSSMQHPKQCHRRDNVFVDNIKIYTSCPSINIYAAFIGENYSMRFFVKCLTSGRSLLRMLALSLFPSLSASCAPQVNSRVRGNRSAKLLLISLNTAVCTSIFFCRKK